MYQHARTPEKHGNGGQQGSEEKGFQNWVWKKIQDKGALTWFG